MVDDRSSGAWVARTPAEVGMNADRLQAAIDYHLSHESAWRP